MNKFKVLFIYPNLMLQTSFPLAISIFSAILKNNDYATDIFDTTFYKTEEVSSDERRVENLQITRFNIDQELKKLKSKDQMSYDLNQKIREFQPNLIAFAILEDLYPLTLKLLEVTKHFGIITIAGGLFPTFAPEKVIKKDGIDIVCVGEGEESLLELCNKLRNGENYANIPNLWVKKNGNIYKNGIRKLRDLNLNPPPDFSLFDERRFYKPMKGKVYRMGLVETNRGCPFTCRFCNSYAQSQLYRKNGDGSYFRLRSIDVIESELKILVEKYKVEFIYFPAEVLLFMSKNYMKEFAKMYKKFHLPFFCQNRAEVLNEETVKLLEEMNCHSCAIGLEHGNEEFRIKMLNRKVSNNTYLHAAKCLSKTNIKVSVNNIIGFPDETRDLVFDTINLNRILSKKFNVYQINAYYYTPYHGTELRQYCVEKGYISEDAQTTYIVNNTILNMPHFTSDEIRGLVRAFTLYARFPKSRYREIAIAERFDEKGNQKFEELQHEYWNNYLR
ncbi:B12-binding domain-containing radical SAM protein [Candidatus Omnitrophota bacterium]